MHHSTDTCIDTQWEISIQLILFIFRILVVKAAVENPFFIHSTQREVGNFNWHITLFATVKLLMPGEYQYVTIFVTGQYYCHEQITDPGLTYSWLMHLISEKQRE